MFRICSRRPWKGRVWESSSVSRLREATGPSILRVFMIFSVGGDFRWITANGVFIYYDTNTEFVIEGGPIRTKSE
jgi:hypothetical protein